MALGATYDPDVLAKLGVIEMGAGADVERAPEAGIKRPRARAQHKPHSGSRLLQIASSVFWSGLSLVWNRLEFRSL